MVEGFYGYVSMGRRFFSIPGHFFVWENRVTEEFEYEFSVRKIRAVDSKLDKNRFASIQIPKCLLDRFYDACLNNISEEELRDTAKEIFQYAYETVTSEAGLDYEKERELKGLDKYGLFGDYVVEERKKFGHLARKRREPDIQWWQRGDNPPWE